MLATVVVAGPVTVMLTSSSAHAPASDHAFKPIVYCAPGEGCALSRYSVLLICVPQAIVRDWSRERALLMECSNKVMVLEPAHAHTSAMRWTGMVVQVDPFVGGVAMPGEAHCTILPSFLK